VIILSLAVFDRVKAEGFAPDVPINSRALDQAEQGSMTAICCCPVRPG
jgi:hypothetical protein